MGNAKGRVREGGYLSQDVFDSLNWEGKVNSRGYVRYDTEALTCVHVR